MNKKKIEIPLILEEYVSRLKQIGNLEIIPVDETVWVENIALD